MNEADAAFVSSFAKYVRWKARLSSEDVSEKMLEAFGAFLEAHEIGSSTQPHYELMEGMSMFAKGSGSGGPRGGS